MRRKEAFCLSNTAAHIRAPISKIGNIKYSERMLTVGRAIHSALTSASCFSEKVKQRAKVTIIFVCVTNTRLTCSSSRPFGSNPASPASPLVLVLCNLSLTLPEHSETFNNVHIPKKENEWDWWTFEGYEMVHLVNMVFKHERHPYFFSLCLQVAEDNTH